MADLVFVDTNVLVYARDTARAEKQEQAANWMEHLWRTRTGRLSVQVLQEFYVTVSAKIEPGLPAAAARNEVRGLMAWDPLLLGPDVLEGAWVVEDRYGLSWWDALIVSAAQVAGCRFLLTEDLQDDQQLGNVRVLNPFAHTPAVLA